MPLEATMMIIDNSEYMRNGDYEPTRFEAQADSVVKVFLTKCDSNEENKLSLMTMAGKGPEVMVTNTKERGQLLNGLKSAREKIGGEINIPTAINVAQLALKHRENKNTRQRIFVFVGSPLGDSEDCEEQAMIKLAKKLKKNNVAVDIVAFGDAIEEEGGSRVLKAFVDNVNSGDNSHFIAVYPGSLNLKDSIMNSPLLAADISSGIPAELGGTGGASEGAGPSGAANDFEFGFDPSMDPELAMALRLSMQEAEARAAAAPTSESAEGSASSAAPVAAAAAAGVAATTAATSGSAPAEPTDDEEERLLQEALAMSKDENAGGDDDEDDDDDEEEDGEGDGDVEMDDEEDDDDEEDEDEDEDEDAAIQKAIQMSMQTQKEEESKKK